MGSWESVLVKTEIYAPVSDENNQGHAVAQLVRTRRRTRRISSGKFVKQPVRRCAKALLMLLSTDT